MSATTTTTVVDTDKEGMHYDRIICPNCGTEQVAQVLHTAPWYSYVHECQDCQYIITESEWNSVIKI